MQKKYYGSEREQLFDWLTGKWLTEGAVACFVEGFPGVGKSDLAAAVAKNMESQGWYSVYVEVPDQANPSFSDTLFTVAERLPEPRRRKMLDLLTAPDANQAYALEHALRDKVLIVFDEAGRLFDEDGHASPALSGVLSYIRHRSGLPGRLLFLSDVAIEQDRWSETFTITKLAPPTPAEAVALLANRLLGLQCADAIPPERMPDLVQVLGCNPRAIEALAGAVQSDSLDDIIGADPGMWQVSDREISREFLKRLERRLLERTLAHLDPTKYQRLTMLAVHRKSFKKEAYGAVSSNWQKKHWRDLQNTLISRFFVTARLGWNSVNPVVREIALARLKTKPSEFATAHYMAAEYHLRHFTSEQFSLDPRLLSTAFAELRYHLFHAGRANEIKDVAIRLGDHLGRLWRESAPIPDAADELDEQIGILSVLLDIDGPLPLEAYLTRCLMARGQPADVQRALVHITRVCASATRAKFWMLKAQIHDKLGQIEPAIQTVLDGLKVVETTDAIAALYMLGADLLAKDKRIDDAILLLRQGILKVPAQNSLSALYLDAAVRLEASHDPDQALVLLTEGIGRIPPDQPLFALYNAAAELLRRQGRIPEAIALLKQGLPIVPVDKGASVIYQSVAEMMASQGQVDGAIQLLKDGIRAIPPTKDLCSLYFAVAQLLNQHDRAREAIEQLQQGIAILPVDKNVDVLYRQAADILREQGRTEDAIVMLRTGMAAVPAGKILASLHRDAAALLLQCNQPEAAISTLKSGVTAAFSVKAAHSLYKNAVDILMHAGQSAAAIELAEQGARRLPNHPGMAELLQATRDATEPQPNLHERTDLKPDASSAAAAVVLVMATEWRSAHGGLSTFNRHLCTTLAKQGHSVYCAVPQPDDGDMAHAREHGVTLVPAAPTPGSPELTGLSRPLPLPAGVSPTLIIGHGRITGAAAKDQQTHFYKHAKRIHFIHMAAGEIEWFKEPERAAEKAEERERTELALASSAQLVAAVGPRLLGEIGDLLRGSEPMPYVTEFVPGPVKTRESPVSPPNLNHCLVLGRADDWELKGLDIAARALSYVVRDKRYERSQGDTQPELIIRGASPGTGAALRRKLEDYCDGVDLQIKPKEYSANENTVELDINRAALMLMPSRGEGFGLVALEALAQGTPVLATSKSGFADVVRKLAPEHLVINTVVETPANREKAAAYWADAIGRQLMDKKAAFARAAELGQVLASKANWEIATQTLMAQVARL